MYCTVGIIIARPTIVLESNRLFLKIIAKSESQPESSETNPSCSPINACAGPPQNTSSASWQPQPRHHPTAPPHPDRNRILTLSMLPRTAEIRCRSPALTMRTVVASKSRDRSRRTPLCHRIYLSRNRIREDWSRESGKFVADL
jgi:hypothetical protein